MYLVNFFQRDIFLIQNRKKNVCGVVGCITAHQLLVHIYMENKKKNKACYVICTLNIYII